MSHSSDLASLCDGRYFDRSSVLGGRALGFRPGQGPSGTLSERIKTKYGSEADRSSQIRDFAETWGGSGCGTYERGPTSPQE